MRYKFKKQKLNPKYIDGRTLKKHYCTDCEKKLSNYRAIRYSSCENKRRFKGKTYEELYGKEKAQKLKELRRKSQINRPKSIEQRIRQSKIMKGKPGHFIHHTKESKRKLSLSHGGTGIPYEFSEYGTEFDNALKEQVRFRDHYKCQVCGCSQLENGRQLDCHHIDYDKENNKLINLIALCVRCHMKTNGNREYWQNLFENRIKEKIE